MATHEAAHADVAKRQLSQHVAAVDFEIALLEAKEERLRHSHWLAGSYQQWGEERSKTRMARERKQRERELAPNCDSETP